MNGRNYEYRRMLIIGSFAALVIGLAVASFSACQEQEYEQCTSKGEPSDFWTKYDLPEVEGAELCSEYEVEKRRVVTFVHYHDSEHSYTDYSDPYEVGFTKTGWRTAKVTSSRSAWGMHLARGAETLYVSFEDCYAEQDISLRRSCTSVAIQETDGVPAIK